MNTCKITAAFGCFSDKKVIGLLPLKKTIEGKTVFSILKLKHAQASPANTNYVSEVSEDTMPDHPSIVEQLIAKTIRKTTLKKHGSHGPSGLDTYKWRRIISRFN